MEKGYTLPKAEGKPYLYLTLRTLPDFVVSRRCFQMLLSCRALWWVYSVADLIFFNFALWLRAETWRKWYRSTALRRVLFKARVNARADLGP